MAFRHQGNLYQQQRVPESFEAVISAGKSTEWYDDALYFYAEWLSGSGEVIILENGQQRREQNYKKALKVFPAYPQRFQKRRNPALRQRQKQRQKYHQTHPQFECLQLSFCPIR